MIKCIKVVKEKNIEVIEKINKVLRITILIALLLLIFGISYAYFTANISGSESSTTISVNAGTMEITFSGGLDITMNNIYPRDEVWGTKNFAVTGNSTTILPMYYSLSLVVETNTFVNNDLKYILLFTNTGSNGDALIPVGMQSIPSGTNDLVIGSGFFTGPTGGNKVHNFTLEFYFPETGENQNDNKGKSFAAHVKIEEGIQELASGTISGLKDTVLFANGTSAGIKAIEQRDNLLLSSSPGPLWIYEMNSPEEVSSIYANQGFLSDEYYFSEDKSIYYSFELDQTGNPVLDENIEQVSLSYIFTIDDVGKYYYDLDDVITQYFVNNQYILSFFAVYKINQVQGGIVTNATKYSVAELPDWDFINEGMFAMEDDYGTSYYFRGDSSIASPQHQSTFNKPIKAQFLNNNSNNYKIQMLATASIPLNNNIIFAEQQWKIVRINGDGSVRLFYFKECPDNSCTISLYADSMGLSTFNTNYDDNKYVGYMYGGAAGVASTSRAQATTNETSSTIKTYLDNWYSDTLLDSGYDQYISDTLFCNDRQLQSELGGPQIGTGFGNSETIYGAYYRLSILNATLKCGLKNDRFTVDDTTIGNGALTYPIGLLTADELALAGNSIMGLENSENYLHTGDNFWTLTPQTFITYARILNQYFGDTKVDTNNYSVYGVINLKPDTPVIGSGSDTDPYIVLCNDCNVEIVQ